MWEYKKLLSKICGEVDCMSSECGLREDERYSVEGVWCGEDEKNVKGKRRLSIHNFFCV